jgi:hypothetical protein
MGEELFTIAGNAADGLEFVFPYDPNREDPAWLAFKRRFTARFGNQPDAFASLAYDCMNVLLQSVCRAGLNRGRIRDALTSVESYKGVTGEMRFDPNAKNIMPMFLGTVRNGRVEYRRYGMSKEYARVGEAGVAYSGPPMPDLPAGEIRVGVFGPRAVEAVAAVGRPDRPYTLVPIASDVPWGKASSALVQAMLDDRLIAVIATDRNSSHLAEQIGVKSFVPVIGISSDRSLTSINIPWIFRLPSGTPLADAVRCVLEAGDKAGPNRGKLRALLASGAALAGGIQFDSTGEPAR